MSMAPCTPLCHTSPLSQDVLGLLLSILEHLQTGTYLLVP